MLKIEKKNIKSKMAAEAIFCVPRDSALVNPVDRFRRAIRQNACFGTRGSLCGSER